MVCHRQRHTHNTTTGGDEDIKTPVVINIGFSLGRLDLDSIRSDEGE